MKQSKNKIKASDLIFCVGLPCAILEEGDPISHYIEGVDVTKNEIIAERVNWKPSQIKPILKRLEDWTIEDTVFLSCNILGYDDEPKKYKKWHANDLRDIKEYGFIQFATHDSIHMPKVIEYFIREGYDLGLLPKGTYLIQNKNVAPTEN
jgi:hypothetical protein